MDLTRRGFLASVPAGLALGAVRASETEAEAPWNVVLCTTDGLRWQEVFGGADEALLNKPSGGVANVDALRKDFWRDTREARREALMPFFWSVIAKKGMVHGDRESGSPARVTNGKNFSYPGYNELLTGAPDPRIDSNDKRPNPNTTVLEWLASRPAFAGKVAAFGAWDVFPYIINEQRSGVPVVAGWDPIRGNDLSERERLLNDLLAGTHRLWDGECYDSFTFEAALEHLRRRRPRVLYIAFGETDEFAHEGRYDHYLHAANRFDAALRRLWETLESLPEYRGRTSLLVSTDHGRGDAPTGWKSHGASVPGSDAIWMAAMGPRTPALGLVPTSEPVTQSQYAATAAALVGEDFRAAFPNTAPPLARAVEGSTS